jgi:oxygen-independent coproporphyrinogen-3 oxidase
MKLPDSDNAGLYVHIPFCVKKCPYCDFYSVTDLSLKQRFLKALIEEMEAVSNEGLCFDTLYIGGGTPSVYDHKDIRRLLAAIPQNFNFSPQPEITFEANPGTVSLEKLEGYLKAGINRLNIGVQSFHQSHLNFLGRVHSADEARQALIQAKQAGFSNIGIDLIYGLPQQTRADWLEDLKQAVEYAPIHLSCYMLTYEEKTPLHSDVKNKRVQPLTDERVRALFETTIQFLEDNGYFQYEISNFAMQGIETADHVSRHNLKYWTRAPYIGLGPSAHSFIKVRRYWNMSSVEGYLKAIESGQSPIADSEVLSAEQKMIEAIYLGLRMTRGIELAGFRKEFGIDFIRVFKDVIAEMVKRNYLQVDSAAVALTRKGRAFLDSIAARFI